MFTTLVSSLICSGISILRKDSAYRFRADKEGLKNDQGIGRLEVYRNVGRFDALY